VSSHHKSPHLRAVVQALFVTFLWSTSWVLIKIGLEDLPALTFAGLRYVLAFLCLAPMLALRPGQRAALGALGGGAWLRLLGLGLLLYAVTQGAQFVGLSYLPAATVNLLLSLSSAVVAVMGLILLAERLRATQWLGIWLAVLGAFVYFSPGALPEGQMVGVAVVLVGVLANSSAAVLGRYVNREGSLSPLAITVVSMGVGSVALLVTGVAVQGLPPLSLQSWLIIVWLATVNSAFAFTLWNLTLRTLSAAESSIINNTMLIQIPLLAWVFLGESLGGREIAGLILALLGTLLVQLPRQLRARS
jgi:drug/metabolite transporter (DMT)-like permease